jgi:tRNA A-37 threonylcarbamoyl transferase component Bud32
VTGYDIVERGPAWSEALGRALLEPEGLLARPDTRMLKRRDAGRTVGMVCLDGEDVVVKPYEEDGVIDGIERLVLGSAAARAARGIARMREVGFATPDLVAVLETPLVHGARRSVLATRAVAGQRADHARESLPSAERAQLAARLGSYVRELHARGAYPQDLWMTNWIVARDGGDWRWVLVDLDRVRLYRKVSWRRRLKNLVQIERSLGRLWSAAERSAFLAAYLGPADREEVAKVEAQIAAASRRRDERRGPLRA